MMVDLDSDTPVGYTVLPGTVVHWTRRYPESLMIQSGNVYRPLKFLCHWLPGFDAAYKYARREMPQ